MIEHNKPVFDWRMKIGITLFVLSFVLPLGGIPALTALGLSDALAASIGGVFIVTGELLGIGAVAVMGKSGYHYLKARVFGFLKQYAPPAAVSKRRYYIGLLMFAVPIVYAWVRPYAAVFYPSLAQTPVGFAVAGDLLLLSGLLVLGGDFWEKLRNLFIHTAPYREKEAADS
jgi:hypothetical protein